MSLRLLSERPTAWVCALLLGCSLALNAAAQDAEPTPDFEAVANSEPAASDESVPSGEPVPNAEPAANAEPTPDVEPASPSADTPTDTPTGAAAPEAIQYSRDVRPLLSNTCYTCHGPDSAQRSTELRLDNQETVFAELDSGARAVVPGNRQASELYQRISNEDADLRMPPADSGKQLTSEQIELIGRWIDQGASWQGHWSFENPSRPAIPEVSHANWVRNPIDAFIAARLESQGLSPSPEADKATLLRRVTYDLTGLPPTLEELDAFLADNSPQAYENVVTRLLDSPRYGEHMGRFWLDAARYGDTHGLHLDNFRSIWPYRDWVFRAFNDNMPFDQFTIEQMAGDLLTEPTLEQRIATGFHRCNVTTSEGGSIDEEYRVRYAIDRVETTSTVWLGLTMGCAVCHEHKFDPFTQKEFYQLFSFYNNVTEKAMDGNRQDPPPVVKAPSPEQAEQLAALTQEIQTVEAQLATPSTEILEAQASWEADWTDRLRDQWHVLDPIAFTSTGGATLRKLDDASVLAEGENPAKDTYEVTARTDLEGIVAVRLEALTHESLIDNGPGRAANSNLVLSEFEAEAVSVADPSVKQTIRFVFAQADFSQTEGEYFVSKAIDGKVDPTNGWAVAGNERHENRTAIFVADAPVGFEGGTELRFRLRHESQFTQHAIGRFRLSVSQDGSMAPATTGPWHVVGPFPGASGSEAFQTDYGPEQGVDLAAAYQDGKLPWKLDEKLTDGRPHALRGGTAATYLTRTLNTPSPRKVTLSLGSDDALKVWLNGNLVLERDVQRALKSGEDKVEVSLEAGENRLLVKVVNYGGAYAFQFDPLQQESAGEGLTLGPIFARQPDQRSDQQRQQLRDYYLEHYDPQWKALKEQVAALNKSREQLDAQIPTTLVMQDVEQPRETFVLLRGEYDKPLDKVTADVPEILPSLPEGIPPNRLALARWLVADDHPLTARVTVNRYWQQYFGTGIVKTPEDFGSQGEWPSHPALLDWLATEFRESGWDVKHMQRLIVTSAAYRQDSRITPRLLKLDPENRLLGRGPRFRLDAEMLRDTALSVSGLLVNQLGGSSVKPYQPQGLWRAVGYTSSNTAQFKRDDGENLYRRSVYTFWKRTSPPPSMSTLDAPSRESCTVRRARTNTPLQALLMMNDVQYIEAARALAQRIMHEGGENPQQRLAMGFRLVTSRTPSSDELDVLLDIYRQHLADYQSDPEAASKLIHLGESSRDASLNAEELAAWTMVANLLLNLDEAVTKN
jgi:hypothetical protein